MDSGEEASSAFHASKPVALHEPTSPAIRAVRSILCTVEVQLDKLRPPLLGAWPDLTLGCLLAPLFGPRLRFLFRRLAVEFMEGGCEVFILKVP